MSLGATIFTSLEGQDAEVNVPITVLHRYASIVQELLFQSSPISNSMKKYTADTFSHSIISHTYLHAD